MLKGQRQKAHDEKEAEFGAVATKADDEPAGLGVNKNDADGIDDTEERRQWRSEAPEEKQHRARDLDACYCCCPVVADGKALGVEKRAEGCDATGDETRPAVGSDDDRQSYSQQ